MLSSVSDTLIDEGVAPDESASVERRSVRRLARSWSERPTPWLPTTTARSTRAVERGARWERATGWIVVAICTLMVIAIIDPHTRLWPIWARALRRIFRNTTTNGGDMGAHVWMAVVPRAQLVPEVPALGLGARLVRRLPGRAVLLPVPVGDGRGPQHRRCRTTSRSSS